jgi:erythromycin esterase
MIQKARIIAMGESTHGTSEFFRLKHRILEHCVREHGVRLFAIEDHQLVVRRVNNYVLGGKGDARSCMYGMLGVWQTEEVRDLIQWMRYYNDLHPDDKVQFVGFDIQNHSIPIDSLYSFVERKSPELLKEVKMHLDDLQHNGMNSYSVPDSVKLGWYTKSLSVLELISTESVEWFTGAKNYEDSLDIIWGVQYANLVKQFAENAWRGHSSLYRDVAMAENVSWYLDVLEPGSKMVVWAHDVHISRGESLVVDENIYGGRSMGAHLSKKYGENYAAFGLFTFQGEYSCYVSYSNFTVTDCPLYIAPRGTLDEALHQVASGEDALGLFLNLKKARSNTWLTKPTPVRFANHVNIEYGYWTKYSIPYQFDGIFFIDKTTSARSYAREN